jgi:hypothetical protein
VKGKFSELTVLKKLRHSLLACSKIREEVDDKVAWTLDRHNARLRKIFELLCRLQLDGFEI